MPPEEAAEKHVVTMAESEAEFGPIEKLWYGDTEVRVYGDASWGWSRPECFSCGYAEMRDALWAAVKYLTDRVNGGQGQA